MDFFRRLFDTSGFPARWHCGLWTPAHGWLHILSDLGVWSAYVAIPCVLAYFVLRRRDVPFKNLFWLFGAFILACGSTHLLEALIFWWPAYRFLGLVKVFTAIVSWATVAALVPIVPVALSMRSPEELQCEVEARKAAEAGLREANEDLEQRIEARTADLSEAHRRKDEFLATLAHELRNPLAPIRTNLEVLRRRADREAHDRALSSMERQLGQMVHLVDDLLDVSRITQGKLELRKTRMDLRTAVRNAVETSRALIDSGGHQLRVEVTDEPLWVDGDATRLTQVFANLLNNAAKFTEPLGRIMLTATVEGGEAVVRVTDSGVGIPKEMLPQIWESFVQGDRSLERARGGLGIGLTLVKRLLELHGGDIAAHSEGAGRGSEFIVRLPLTPAPETAPDHPVHLETPPAPTRRVLVVDDNHDAAESLVDLLETLGHESRMVFDGVAAVEAAAEYRPDLIILDLGLPKLNGYDACRRIREQTGKPRPAIAALTGWGQEEDRRRSQAAGFDVHLVKPLEIDVLQQMLRELPGPRPSSAQERE